MPLIAIQMNALKIGEHVTLVFTRVVDLVTRGPDDDGEFVAPTSRKDWEAKASHGTVGLMDQLFSFIKHIDPSLELKYNKYYARLAKDGEPDNFVYFRPQKNSLIVRVKIPKSEDIENKLAQAGLEIPEYDSRRNNYPIRIGKEDVQNHADLLAEIMRLGYDYQRG